MVTTRGQQEAEASGKARGVTLSSHQADRFKERSEYGDAQAANKHGIKPENESQHRGAEPAEESPKQASPAIYNPTIRCLLATYGSFPLEASALSEPKSPTPATLLAHLLNALLSSARISHGIASKTIGIVIEAGYANLETLEKSTWEERTEVLTEGGYTHYREKTATELGGDGRLGSEGMRRGSERHPPPCEANGGGHRCQSSGQE